MRKAEIRRNVELRRKKRWTRDPTKGPQLKRVRINKVSTKTKQKRDAMAIYRVWLKDAAGGCMKCRKKLPTTALDVHEIPAGAHRDRALKNPWTWLVVCRGCHDELQGIDPADQVEVLFEFIRSGVNECFGRNVL